MVPTWAISALEVTFLALDLELRDDGRHGEINTALEIHWVGAGGNRLRTFSHDRLGENGSGRRAVAGNFRRLGGNLLEHLRAHVFELIFKLDVLGDRHAVLGDAGRAERLIEHDVAALGPECHLHRVGENIDAAQHPIAGILGKLDVLGCHVEQLLIGTEFLGGGGLRSGFHFCRSVEHTQYVALLHNEPLLAIEFDLAARPLAEQDTVADLDFERRDLAGLVAGSRADGNDLALLRLFLGGIGDNDPACCLGLFLDALHDHAVVQRTEFHRNLHCIL